ncbi:DUF1684 domain-containing protein [Streptomyces sp. URMC 126]|uniref:DUF1684 domain-containing protein n=1 Tax=Streptomyces sp. URMC 126 TaxID=3423401 RepID=UPI003F1BA5B7
MNTDDARQQWAEWRELRRETASAPYGPLALTATHWLADHPGGRLPDVPGRWAGDDDGVLLAAAPEDGLVLDGEPFAGEARLAADASPAAARAAHGARRLVVLCREGLWAVRVFDPAAPARREFAGIDAFPHDGRWVRPGRYRPYDRRRTVLVGNADGRERGLSLSGELSFELAGEVRVLRVAEEADGALWAVFSDATSGADGPRFRFLRTPAPDAAGRVEVDLNRAVLPPCAFADHFICPFPPPGNDLPVAVEAGERAVLTR